MAREIKTSGEIRLNDVRLSFPNLWVPKKFGEDSKPRFEAIFLLDPNRKDHAEKIKELKAAIKALAVAAYGDDIPADILSGEKVALHNNVIENDGVKVQRKKYAGFADMYYLSTSSPAKLGDDGKPVVIYVPGTTKVDYYKGQPPVINRQKQPVRDGQPEAPYAGCRVNAIVSFWAQPKGGKWGARINCNLLATQFNGDDEPLGRGGIDVDSAFEAIGDAPAENAGAAKAVARFLD